MSDAEKKTIVALGTVLALWRIVQLPPVEEAFLRFLAIGQVPGTQIILAPDTVIMALPWVFSASLLIIFRKEIRRSFRPSSDRTVKQKATSPSVQDQPTKNGVVIRAPRRHTLLQTAMPKLALPDRKLPVLYIPSIRPFIRMIATSARSTSSWVWSYCRGITRATQKRILLIIHHTWRWLEPRIREFDRWLDKELHNNRYTAEVFEILEDCWRAARGWWGKSKTS